MPAGEKLTSEIVAMQRAMEKAVSCEDFEEAAKLRDVLHTLKADSVQGNEGGNDQ
jgi:protein-arginine kinase activator protein McsA